jgi:Ca2+-binding EF-hand superfamily protein
MIQKQIYTRHPKMNRMREQWDAFDTKDLTAEKTRDLLRLCGYCPREGDITVPRSFEEFQELSRTIAPPISKEEMKSAIGLFHANNHISYKSLQKYLMLGDKFSDQEMLELYRMCPFNDDGEIGVGDFVEFLYEE